MIILTLAALIYSCFPATSGQFLDCDWVQTLYCPTYGGNSDCGSDGITYPNRCYFAKAQCIDKFLNILHVGDCAPWEVSTTPSPPGSGVDGETAILDFFCTQLSHRNCGNETSIVCGTDGRDYQNFCEYDKARCTHRDLHVQAFGKCQNIPPTTAAASTTQYATPITATIAK